MRSPKPVALPDLQGRRVRAFHGGLRVEGGGDVATLDLYDAIGFDGITAGTFRRALDAIRAPRIALRINSPGGDVFDGLAIYNDLVSHPAAVDVSITGLAASAASVVAMAGDTVTIADNAFVMLHKAWAVAIGNAADLRHTAGVLDQVDQSLAGIYSDATGHSREQIAAWMSEETWLAAADAVRLGFADALTGEQAQAMAFDLSGFGHVPAHVKRRNEQALRSAGMSRREARQAAVTGLESLPGDDGEAEALRTLRGLALAFRSG